MKKKAWKMAEEKILIENYETCTIKELEALLPGRNADSINAKIKRLKGAHKLTGNKDEATVRRAFDQRGR